MEIQSLRIKSSNLKLEKAINKMQRLINALNKRGIPQDLTEQIDNEIKRLNRLAGNEKNTRRAINKAYTKTLKLLESELKLVTKNYYRNLWMSLGMVFGIPFGTVFSSATGNYGFIGIGLPIGMAIGIAYGTSLDKKAEKEGRQLDLICDSEII